MISSFTYFRLEEELKGRLCPKFVLNLRLFTVGIFLVPNITNSFHRVQGQGLRREAIKKIYLLEFFHASG